MAATVQGADRAPDDRRISDGETLPERTSQGRSMQAAVYGTILALSLVAVTSEYQRDPLRIMASVLVTQLVFYLAHVYAAQLGLRLEGRGAPSRAQLREILVQEWPLLAAAGPPCAALLIGGLSPLDDRTSILLALWVGVGTLVVYGIRLGRAEQRRWIGVAATATVNGLLGLVIVAMKVIVH